MPRPDALFSPPGLDRRFEEAGLTHDLAAGTVTNEAAERLLYVPGDALRSIQQTLREDTGDGWKIVLRHTGRAGGRRLARELDAALASAPRSPAGRLPLEPCTPFLERCFRLNGWGRLVFDFSLFAPHGVILARVANSCFAEVLRGTEDCADPFVCGLLEGFCGEIRGEAIGCEELECARRATELCTFVLAAPARLQAVDGMIGHARIEEVLAALQTPAR